MFVLLTSLCACFCMVICFLHVSRKRKAWLWKLISSNKLYPVIRRKVDPTRLWSIEVNSLFRIIGFITSEKRNQNKDPHHGVVRYFILFTNDNKGGFFFFLKSKESTYSYSLKVSTCTYPPWALHHLVSIFYPNKVCSSLTLC